MKKILTILPKLVIIIILLVAIYFYSFVTRQYKIQSNTSPQSVYALINGNKIRQPLSGKYVNGMEAISIQVGTGGNNNTCVIDLQIIDTNTTNIVAQKSFLASEIKKDNAYYDIKLDKPVSADENHNYELIISSPDGAEGNAIYIYTVPADESKGELPLYYNDSTEKSENICMLKITKNLGFDLETFAVCIIFVLYIWGFIKLLYKFMQ